MCQQQLWLSLDVPAAALAILSLDVSATAVAILNPFFQQWLWLSLDLSLDDSATAPDITSIPERASLGEEGATAG